MGLEINPQWSFKELVEHIWALRDEFDRLLTSFSYFDLHEKVVFLKTTRDTIYSMDFEEGRKDKIWNYFNHYEYYTTLRDMAERMKQTFSAINDIIFLEKMEGVHISSRYVKGQLIRDFKLQKAGMDFMGYDFQTKGSSYHHLLTPRRLGGLITYENGAVLMQSTAHNYLHTIEKYDLDIFNCITKAMQDEKEKEYIDIEDLKYIKDCLLYFERYYGHLKTNKGKPIVKEYYITKRKI